MTPELPPIILKGTELAKFRRLKKKYPVSREFLYSNWANAKRFIVYALNPRCVLRYYAWRKRRSNRIIIVRRARLLLFDPRLKRMIKHRKANVKQWSSKLVQYRKMMGHVTEYEETELYGEELSKQMKEQLALLKSSKRSMSLIEDTNKTEDKVEHITNQAEATAKSAVTMEKPVAESAEKPFLETVVEPGTETLVDPITETATTETVEKPVITAESVTETIFDLIPKNEDLVTADVVQPSGAGSISENVPERSTDKSGGSKFLDMLMNKVRVKNFARESNFCKQPTELDDKLITLKTESKSDDMITYSDDISEDFVGFDDSDHQPGMLLTPLVPLNCKTVDGNAAFVSESLDAYMEKNKICNNLLEDREHLFEPMYEDGRVTSHSMPPHMDMPAVPDSLQRLRTVADRRLYLQRSKNQKMTIINNEANIYRELQRKQRRRKVKIAAMQQLQSSSSQMPFTRQGWQAASYVATEHDKYYYQVIRVDGEMLRLPGSQGNNLHREKQPYRSQVADAEAGQQQCGRNCPDAALLNELRVLPTMPSKMNIKFQRLNQNPLPAIFRPCPLSQKPFQKPLDDDTAVLLLAGGSMAVVSMPTVQLDVIPQLGRPLDEIAKRYLQHILPHHDITREWAEFSVSTLQESPNSMRAAEAQAQKAGGRRKSFTFVIPYLNDRNHILVRRVVDRSEELDPSFSRDQPAEKLQEFEFRKMLTKEPDPIELDCADMIKDMINTVAISCSENSFISVDPDAASNTPEISPAKEEILADKADKTGAKLPTSKRRPDKQQRLAKELRRLNATIIDAAAIAKEANKPCIKDHCQLGCICDSLNGQFPPREHCGRAECVLECHCTGAELARIMRVETDGCGISNEDAFNLRRQATARLAKMEKDFTSTLVLTDNETLLISETQCDKKRRCTKAPKRYEDFDDSIEDDEEVIKPSKASKRESNLKRTRTNAQRVKTPPVSVYKETCTVKDTDFHKLKHCQVTLRRLPDVANLATFCMTHQLYKCFCGGLAEEGKPVVIEKEQHNAIIAPYVPELATRAHYSFERAQEEPQQSKKKRKEKPQTQQQLIKVQNLVKIQPKKVQPVLKVVLPVKPSIPSAPPTPISPPTSMTAYMAQIPDDRSSELDIICSYYRSTPNLPRRVICVPKKCYLRLNRRRADRVSSEAARMETPKTQALLEQNVSSAVRFYRAELDQQRRMEQQKRLVIQEIEPSIIELYDDSDDESSTSTTQRASSTTNGPSTSNTANLANFLSAPPKLIDPLEISRKRVAEIQTHELDQSKQVKRKKVVRVQECNEKKPSQDEKPQQISLVKPIRQLDIQMPKISACYSLNANAAAVVSTENSLHNVDSALAVDDENSMVFRTSYNDVIQKMNTHVSKKMQDIDLALQRESKIIPAPNEEILCIIKWTNFLGAFESDFVYIWDVQMKNYTFMAATITNMMPAIVGAIAVVNTRFAPDQSALPAMARMLMEGKRNENTARLAVVMQGRQQYWLVKGFLRYMEGNACTKPTPQTHPVLTKKINVLCTLMVKQRIREQQRKQKTTEDSTAIGIAPVPVPLPISPAGGAPSTSTAAPAFINAVVPSPVLSKPESLQHTKDTALNIRSNIEFRKVREVDVKELQIPELHSYDHRWVVLNLYDDFSHIFVPAFRDMISLDRIHNVMRVAHETKKVVKLQFFQDAPYDAFVTSSSKRKIYFGPLRLDMQPPVLVLLQSVDGKMMLREVYQREHNIPVQREKRTMAFWVLQINNQVHFEIDMTSVDSSNGVTQLLIPRAAVPLLQLQNITVHNNNEDEDDDDCVIIDDDDDENNGEEAERNAEPEMPQLDKEQKKLLSMERTNLTIQTLPNRGVQIKPTIKKSPAASKDSARGGFLPFIANVPAMGRVAPTTQFLTPQVQLTQTAAPSFIKSETSAQPPPAKISRISVQRCPSSATTITAKESSSSVKVNETLQQLLSGGTGNFQVGATGITITKVKDKEKNSTVSKEPIKVGRKRKTPSPSVATPSFGAPTILKQTDTTISIGNLPPRQIRPLPKLAPKLEPSRKSLPTMPTCSNQQRPMQPVKMAGSNESRQSLPAKVPEIVPKSERGNQAACLKTNQSKYVCGFLVATNLPRFRVKIVDSKYMVKVGNEGVLTFINAETAYAYLNRYLLRNTSLHANLPGDWKFLPFDNNQNQKTILQQQQAATKITKMVSTEPPATPIVIED